MIIGRIATCILLMGIVLASWLLEFVDDITSHNLGWIPFAILMIEHIAFISLAMEWLIRGGYF